MERIPRTERIVIAGDMNAQVGENSDGYEGVHGGLGFRRRKLEGERLFEVAEAADMKILNTMFKKRRNHLITYKSGGNETQIDYIMVRKEDSKLVMDCKVIPGEPVVTQHRLLIADLRMKVEKKRRKEERKRKIKVWELRDEKKSEFRQKVEGTLIERYGNGTFPERVEELWIDMTDILVTKATEVYGKTNGKPRKEKDTWWWNDEVQREIKEKKLALQQMKENENDITKERYRQAKRKAKRAVAIAKRHAYRDWYEKLDTPEGEKIIYRVAKARNEGRKDVGELSIMKDQNGNMLTKEEDIKRR